MRKRACPVTEEIVARAPLARRCSVTREIPSYLRLHVEEPTLTEIYPPADSDALQRLCRSFQEATGHRLLVGSGNLPRESETLLWARSFGEQSSQPGYVAIDDADFNAATPPLDDQLEPACQLAESVAQLLAQLHETRHALWHREAELAVGVPLVSRPDEDAHLAERLQAILKGAAEAVDAQAAALYLLDDATSQLKLRAAWGLPPEQFVEPARPLRGAVADLEALTGHAVVLEDTSLLANWKCPHDFASAVCVPVSTPTTPLGTLWVFGEHVRDFTTSQTNIIEIVAGRLASDLEREILLASEEETRSLRAERDELGQLQADDDALSHVYCEGWDLAARCHRGRDCGDFLEWFHGDEGGLRLALGSAHGRGLAQAVTAALVRGATKSALLAGFAPRRLAPHVNDVLWTSSTGDQFASLMAVQLPAVGGQIDYCSAGPVGALILSPSRPSSIAQGAPPLGSDPDAAYSSARRKLQIGDAVLVVSDAVRKAINAQGEQLGEAAIAECAQSFLDQPLQKLVDAVYELWHGHTDDPRREISILAARRAR